MTTYRPFPGPARRALIFCTTLGILLFLLVLFSPPPVQAAESGLGDEQAISSLPLGAPGPAPFAPTAGRRIVLAQSDAEPGRTDAAKTGAADDMTFWEWLWDYLYNGASLTVGVGTRQAELKVTEKSTQRFGKIVQRDEEAYFISYSTRPSFLNSANFGYTFMLNYATFNLDKQEISKNVYEDIGTRVRGRTAYVVPSFFYQWGQHEPYAKFIRLGVGLGLGVAKYQGDIILTDPSPTGPIPISNGSYDLKAALGGFLEARYRFIGLMISGAGPSYQDDTYKYDVRDIAVYLGFTYYF